MVTSSGFTVCYVDPMKKQEEEENDKERKRGRRKSSVGG